MFKKTILMVVVVSLLMTGGVAFAMTKADKGGDQAIIIIGGRVTQIKGNIITIMDNQGIERQFELNSAADIKIGASAICEEDCGKGLRIGDRSIRVKRVLETAPRR